MELLPTTAYCKPNSFTGLEEVFISSVSENYEELQPSYSKLVKKGRPLRGSLNRPPRTEELLQLAAEQVVAGASLRRVGNAYNIPRTTLHDYMMRKGLTSQRALKRRILRLEREMTSHTASQSRGSNVVKFPLQVKATMGSNSTR
jgi:helix-turn-helix, Psq domain.